MKIKIHRAEDRGHQDHVWLIANHSFSFANYHDPEKVHFGVLRVLNDDFIAAGRGFGAHPHANMEIITIPLTGVLQHRDSIGNFGAIKKGEIQVMSAGTGIQHSEYNGSESDPVTLLQIWIIPNKMNVKPRYDQIRIDNRKVNEFQQIISPNPDDAGSWIYQRAWFHLGEFTKRTDAKYELKEEGNGIYLFVIEGTVALEGQKLGRRDAMEITGSNSFELQISAGSEILVMEVPMDLPRI